MKKIQVLKRNGEEVVTIKLNSNLFLLNAKLNFYF